MTTQQNKLAYITGTSRGIGKALAELLLDQGFDVVGIARNNSIKHENFTFVSLDLNDIEAVNQLSFDRDASSVLLVNNAGIVGEIYPVGKVSANAIQRVMNVNTIAPQILCNNFIKKYCTSGKKGHVINISSGAGKNPIDAWATYCASKAAMDLFSRTVQSEMEERAISDWRIHAIAPGVVDTQMQIDIRNADQNEFKLIKKFENLKQNGELSNSEDVAKKLFKVIETPSKFNETILSVRDF